MSFHSPVHDELEPIIIKKDLTVALILKHYDQARRMRKVFFAQETKKVTNLRNKVCLKVNLIFSVFDIINQ